MARKQHITRPEPSTSEQKALAKVVDLLNDAVDFITAIESDGQHYFDNVALARAACLMIKQARWTANDALPKALKCSADTRPVG